MSEQLIILLKNIEKELEKLNHSSLSYLNRGLNAEEIKVKFLKISLQPNDELITLFSWKNGTDKNLDVKLGHLTIFPGFYFMSLQESIDSYLELRGKPNWKKYWFPIFANGGGDFYAVDLNEKSKGEVIGFFVYEDECMVEYNSLTSMIKTFEECYKKGVIYRDDNGYLDMDYFEHTLIARRINPNLQIWDEDLNA